MDIRKPFFDFIKNEKEYPLLAGFFSGFYVLAFYYSNNFDLANSWQQLGFLSAYFIGLPIAVCLLAYYFLKATRWKKRARQLLFVLMFSFFSFYVLQNFNPGDSYKMLLLPVLIGILLVSFKINNYKIGIVLVFFMSLFPILKIGYTLYRNVAHHSDWNTQPDGILNCKFTKTPNIYYIQVDGYANTESFRNAPYNYDNSQFNSWLEANEFTVYETFRSNYNTTLRSNSSCFNMMHHFSKENSNFKTARDYIMDDNPALRILENNNYKTFFITERPYLMMNRPRMEFDYCNFTPDELPFMKDGWDDFKPIAAEIKTQIRNNKATPNFFFIEKFDPGHIAGSKSKSKGVAGERLAYLERIAIANAWLYDLVGFIEQNDKDAIILVGADHGGYVGFTYTGESQRKIEDKDLLRSIFGASMAIRWNNPEHVQYDAQLKTSVNLFRTLFAFLSEDKTYLDHLQEDASYHNSDRTNLRNVYRVIE